MADEAAAAPPTTSGNASAVSSRPGRPTGRRFARLRQTRLTSLSPTPTLVAGSSSRSRSSQRTRTASATRGSRSMSRVRGDSGGREKDRQEHSEGAGKKKSSDGSRTAVPTSDGAPNPSDVEKGQAPSKEKREMHTIGRVLPYPIAHFLGYRRPAEDLPPHLRNIKPYPSILPFVNRIPLALETLIFAFFGPFISIGVICLVFARPSHFTSSTNVPPHAWASPIIIGSFGASSVLLYASPNSPLSQPRCFMGGQFLSALAGVCVTKLFALAHSPYYNLNDTDTSESIVWLTGAVATALAVVLMIATGTVHPPGGATAVLCATNMQVERLGWKVLPVVLLTSAIMLAWTLIWVNLGRRRYPEAFLAPAPAKGADGNLLQYLIDWIVERRKRRQGQHTAPAHANGTDAWRDESQWKAQEQANGSTARQQGARVCTIACHDQHCEYC